MKCGTIFPSPPFPPTAPTPSPCVYTPQKRKYVPSHSGGIESNPLRAKPRISSRHSQAFFSRFRRSARCALVSVVGILWDLSRKKQNPRHFVWRGSLESASIPKLRLPPPHARNERTTTGTGAHSHVGAER